ncbi:hypothetical protein GJ700_12705 [Duganella sp. FT92W]|uniref:HK97 gp10 family phage protein n=1 Tax=Pseudoduganella rivuli TaxID=2666085 RepID=A0A7X2IMN8_9BURK|nr:HK97-gp10 family putative phage morphogenesis protein [Pseudoduganella rivuli]MRV72568.1 hypothetical protein [Pseudoduganella rivuli]
MSDDLAITGGRELDAFLQSLPAKVEKNIMRAALRAGANVLKDEAKANVPVQLGALRKSVRVTTGSKAGVVTASVKAGGPKAWYWRFVEYGTAPHHIGPKNARALALAGVVVRGVEHPGARPQPFMRPALDAKGSAVIEAVAAKIRDRLTAAGINTAAPETE